MSIKIHIERLVLTGTPRADTDRGQLERDLGSALARRIAGIQQGGRPGIGQRAAEALHKALLARGTLPRGARKS
jgi:hypothetical protein